MAASAMKDPAIRETFSRKEIERRIESAAINLREVDPSEIEAQTNSCTDELVRQLEGTTPDVWIFYLPVENVILKRELIIGRSSIRMFDEEMMNSIIDTFKEMNRNVKSPPEVKVQAENIFKDRVKQDYNGRAVIRVETRAGDTDRAIESAIEQAETALNILRFYSRGVFTLDARAYKMYIDLKGRMSKGQLFLAGFRQLGGHVMSVQNTGYWYELKLGEDEISRMEQDSFKTMHDILAKDSAKRTEFEKLLINSINLFGNAMNNQDTTSAFVSMIVSLESILLKRKEPISTLLPERVALLLGRNLDERMFYFNETFRLYHIRNDVVHRGLTDVTHGDFSMLSSFAYRVLVRLIADSPAINDVGKLVDKSNAQKFGGPSN